MILDDRECHTETYHVKKGSNGHLSLKFWVEVGGQSKAKTSYTLFLWAKVPTGLYIIAIFMTIRPIGRIATLEYGQYGHYGQTKENLLKDYENYKWPVKKLNY